MEVSVSSRVLTEFPTVCDEEGAQVSVSECDADRFVRRDGAESEENNFALVEADGDGTGMAGV